MAKGPYLTPRIEDILRGIYVDNREIKLKEARKSLLDAMKRAGLNETYGSNFPSTSTVSKRLKDFRLDDEARSPELKDLDKPWSIAAMAKYDIPPETLPVILILWSHIMEETPESITKLMTIRVARWIGRLYYVFEAQMPCFAKKVPKDIWLTEAGRWYVPLLLYAQLYAHHEKVMELLKEYPSTYEDMSVLWFRDAELAGNKELADKLKESIKHPEYDLLRGIDEKQWPDTFLAIPIRKGPRRSDKKATNQGKRPGHGVKLPEDKEEAKDESSNIL